MKPGFQNELVSQLKHNSDTIHILHEPLLYWSELLQMMIEMPVGFHTDFCTVPRIPIAYQLWGNRNHREGVLHDFLDRKDALPNLSCSLVNVIFREAMASRGVPWYIKEPMYYGVALCNWRFYHKRYVMDEL